jgi:hypothetical protein
VKKFSNLSQEKIHIDLFIKKIKEFLHLEEPLEINPFKKWVKGYCLINRKLKK